MIDDRVMQDQALPRRELHPQFGPLLLVFFVF